MTNTNPYVCSENNLNTPECISVPYENSEESIEMYGDYDNMQGFDHTLQTNAKSDFHKYLKETHFHATDGKKTNKNFTKWRKNLTQATREHFLKLHDAHKKKHHKNEDSVSGSHLDKAKTAYIHMNSEYKKFYEKFDFDAWTESRRILKSSDTDNMEKMKENFIDKYDVNPKQKGYINITIENKDFSRKNYEDMITCKANWFAKMEKTAKTKHEEDIEKSIESKDLKKVADEAKHVKKSEAAAPF